MKTTTKNQPDILKRMRVIEGHLKMVSTMVETNRYCVDTLHQLMAVRSALKKVQDLIVARHLQTCVASRLKSTSSKKTINELTEIYIKNK